MISRREALRNITAGAGATASALWLDRLRLLAQNPALHAHAAMPPAAPLPMTMTG